MRPTCAKAGVPIVVCRREARGREAIHARKASRAASASARERSSTRGDVSEGGASTGAGRASPVTKTALAMTKAKRERERRRTVPNADAVSKTSLARTSMPGPETERNPGAREAGRRAFAGLCARAFLAEGNLV